MGCPSTLTTPPPTPQSSSESEGAFFPATCRPLNILHPSQLDHSPALHELGPSAVADRRVETNLTLLRQTTHVGALPTHLRFFLSPNRLSRPFTSDPLLCRHFCCPCAPLTIVRTTPFTPYDASRQRSPFVFTRIRMSGSVSLPPIRRLRARLAC